VSCFERVFQQALKLADIPGGHPPTAPQSLPDKVAIPSWWFAADPQKVLADPLFPTLDIDERTEVLAQIDPKFAKMTTNRRNAYLWRAETFYLPKAPIPSEVVRWAATASNCSTEFDGLGALTKTITANGFRIEATLHKMSFFKVHLKIVNNSGRTVQVVPQTFVLNVINPKRYTLFFEYPSRVGFQLATLPARINLDPETLKYILGLSAQIVPQSMASGSIPPGAFVEGDVWFESDSHVREAVLRVSIEDRAFDIPFTIRRDETVW
jgi:hypothetical protein